jgi:putative ABC transport system ATP-binding protein
VKTGIDKAKRKCMTTSAANPTEKTVLKTRALTKRVKSAGGELAILKGIDLEIKAGESVAIVGVSGSGKSTLLGILAGLDTASSGEVFLGGVALGNEEQGVLDEEARAKLRARLVGFVFQSFQLLPGLTALENVMLPLELKQDKQPRDHQALAASYLAQVGLSQRLHHTPKQLSGGEQQRVAIARAFASQPAVLFADEPTGNLDAKTGAQIIDLLFELNRQHHTTLVLVTHDVKLAERCERQLVMEDGSLRG